MGTTAGKKETTAGGRDYETQYKRESQEKKEKSAVRKKETEEETGVRRQEDRTSPVRGGLLVEQTTQRPLIVSPVRGGL
jgi:hypothetical protein